MATSSGTSNSGNSTEVFTGPCQYMMQTYAGGFDKAYQAWDPVMKSMAQVQLEIIGFWNRRAQAYLDLPSRLQQSRGPQDLVAEQMRFWQTAFTQYQDSSRKLMKLYASAVPELPFSEPKRTRTQRDYISVSETPDVMDGEAKGRRAA